ncbi:uncharacterized protein KNAG_0I01850 [Huiozyma naganishii CBS 8797]|uniref:Vacuolar membrane protein n=1 Tax=Huiozyma naganishii (strain ATCC MYA-139 / BCRC 22969 / CBS 8797 / KCTC 17520 / NBRC 10181 / NCYC 3082 / Yp74L-3) TaxID=1071383 RepID=J7RAT8_HUIN7|nr:hypothetical protein KNAG_0I01850 [Kazachstania naganishii CBS 8797]CCK71970.1 hypothetical protein KNAG_0I01850 [Kazachstania naganishii CBS 8797]
MKSIVEERLLLRDLPKLQIKSTPTTTPAVETHSSHSTDLAKSQTQSAFTTTHSAKLLPALSTRAALTTSSSSSTAAASTTAVVREAIVLPSAEDNPYIYHADDRPEGTVFIAVGSIAAFIGIAIAMWWAVTKYLSHKYTKEKELFDQNNLNYSYMEKQQRWGGYRVASDESLFGIDSSNNGSIGGYKEQLLTPIVSNTSNDDNKPRSDIGAASPWQGHGAGAVATQLDDNILHTPFNPIQDTLQVESNRRSMFISPTIELIQHQRGRTADPTGRHSVYNHNSEVALGSNITDDKTGDLNEPRRTASPQRRARARESPNRKSGSNLRLVPSPVKPLLPREHDLGFPNGTTREGDFRDGTTSGSRKNGHKKTPSMYLDDLLKE